MKKQWKVVLTEAVGPLSSIVRTVLSSHASHESAQKKMERIRTAYPDCGLSVRGPRLQADECTGKGNRWTGW